MRRAARGVRRAIRAPSAQAAVQMRRRRLASRASALPRRRRQLIAARHLEYLLWLTVGFALIASLWASPRMQPRQIVIQGVPPAAQIEIEQQLRQLWQEPFGVRLGVRPVETALLQHGWVEAVQVRPTIPSQLQIQVRPRVPLIEIRAVSGDRIFVDSAGIAFRAPNPPERAAGGIISLPASMPLPAGGDLRPATPLWRAFALLKELARTTQARHQIQIAPDGELYLSCQMEGGVAIRFQLGDAALWRQQLPIVQMLLQSAPLQAAQWEYVDLKSPHHPAVKPRAGRPDRGYTSAEQSQGVQQGVRTHDRRQ